VKRDLRPYAGEIIIILSALHFLVGFLVYADPIREIVRAGLFNAIGDHADRDGALWFMVCGVFLLLLGILIRWAQARTGTLPASLGWGFLALSAGGFILMPVSGFALMALPGILLLAVSRQKPGPPPDHS
jgi:hypothetical protein